MISDGRDFLHAAWWIVTLPGVAILVTALSLNLLSTWARSITDPAHRWRWLARRESPTVDTGETMTGKPLAPGTEGGRGRR